MYFHIGRNRKNEKQKKFIQLQLFHPFASSSSFWWMFPAQDLETI